MKNRTCMHLFALVMALCAGVASAQSYPNRPVTLIWPFAAGSGVDAAARALASAVSKRLGQTVIVENRAGANGMIGFNALQKAPKDGYTILMATSGMLAQLPLISKRYTQEPVKDYAPISFLFSQQLVIGANPSVPFRDLGGLIDFAKKNPGALNVATSGTAATTTFAAFLLAYKAGVQFTMVPYKGVAEATPDLLTNRVQVQVMGPQLKEMADTGKLVPIAVTGRTRWRQFPDTPTMLEAGLPDSFVDISLILLAPAGTPSPVIALLHSTFTVALQDPLVKVALNAMSSDTIGGSPEEATAQILAEQKYWAPIIRAAGIKAEGE